ncbi:MAG: exodeoxyribonuclease VII small subunit [Rhodocyclaceae bacterium]|nr:exodeoxyribonuclease VII small subunit [Rhodocyclaceae bacterium]
MAKAVSPTATTATANSPASFEAALSELETIVKSLELGSGNAAGLPLEESLAAYQRGMALLRYCQDALAAAEQRVQVLEKDALRDFTPASEE